MPPPELEEFAKRLVETVRDQAIRNCDARLRQDAKGPIALRWKSLAAADSKVEFAETIIPDCVDTVIFCLLDAIDNELLKLAYISENEKVTNLRKEGHGELAGWYMGTESWRHLYSHERFFDDDADLKNFDFGD